TGRAPFATGSGEAVLARLTVAAEPPSSVRPELSAAFDAVTMLALAARPDNRAQSAQQLAELLAPLADGERTDTVGAIPVADVSSSVPVTAARPAAAAVAPTARTVAADPALAVSAGTSAGSGAGRSGWRAVAAVAVLALVGGGAWMMMQGRGSTA